MNSHDFIIDAHLDLAMNAIEWNRDLRQPVLAIRERENGLTDKPDRGRGTVSLPELRKAGVGLVVATQIARVVNQGSLLPGWNSPEIAWGITQAQLSWYRAMEEQGEMIQICDLQQLERHVGRCLSGAVENGYPTGYILSLEGADSLVNIHYLEKAYRDGLRACGPAHYGPGRYASGTGTTDGFTRQGFELLAEMDKLHMILDVTHLTDLGFQQATDRYQGPIWASHHNCRTLVNHQRQLTDEQIKLLIERHAVIGGVFDVWMLVSDWRKGSDDPAERNVRMERIIDHFDHICQLAGNSLHVAIGSDLDGAFGKEQSPADLDTIADLSLLRLALKKRGYTAEDIENIFYKNWLHFLRNAWQKINI